jgi:hypothetical protein
MWEVGKKYKHKYKTIYEVTYVNEDGALLKYNYGNNYSYTFVTNEEFQYFIEYKESIVHKRWVHFYRTDTFSISTWTARTPEKPHFRTNYKYIGCKEVSITEEVE